MNDIAAPGSALPAEIDQAIALFSAAARDAFADDLVSIVLYGSAAEGRVRPTSDVNMLLVLKRFAPERADRMREPMRIAHAAVQMNAMFLLESEVGAAMEAFAIKFADIHARHRVLFGADPFATAEAPRAALVWRLKQVLLNLQLRMRERYVLVSLREEQLVLAVADSAGPLRSAAASLLQLEGHAAATPKSALEQIAHDSGDAALDAALHDISTARETAALPPGRAAAATLAILDLLQRMRERAARLQ